LISIHHHVINCINMKQNGRRAANREIARHIFSGATTMVGVCIMVITLFKVMNFSLKSYADETLGINSLLFIISSFMSYLSLRNNNSRWMEWIAEILFFIGMLVMVFVGFIIVFYID